MAKEDGVGQGVQLVKEFLHTEIKPGRWREKHLARKETVKQLRETNAHLPADALFRTAAWTSDLAGKFPALGEYWEREEALGVEFKRLVKEGRLWFVSVASCLARSGKCLDSAKVGHFLQYTIVEQLAQEGDQLHVKKMKGIGPLEGWVAIPSS